MHRILTLQGRDIEGTREALLKTRQETGMRGMMRRGAIALGFACGCALAVPLCAQSQQQDTTPSKPGQQQPAQPANPFPEDTNSVPVLPSTSAPASATSAPDTADYSNVSLANGDTDPVRSPDDAPLVPDTGGSSSSDAGMGRILQPPPDDGKSHRRGKHGEDEEPAPHQETAKEDETVGSYYLDQKNWHAALSRYESAVVLDPENPDVYWGLAEAERHMGNFAAARTHYLKVMEYDPDSKHSKEAKKFLAQPEIANAQAAAASVGSQQ